MFVATCATMRCIRRRKLRHSRVLGQLMGDRVKEARLSYSPAGRFRKDVKANNCCI